MIRSYIMFISIHFVYGTLVTYLSNSAELDACIFNKPISYVPVLKVCVFVFSGSTSFSPGKKEIRLQLPAMSHYSCEANKPKARIKKLIGEEATERSVGTCTVASDLSCFTISGKKAGMSAQVKLALRPWHFCLK